MFNDQPWLCHRHIALDVTQCSTWYHSPPQFPVSIFDFVTDISYLMLLKALPILRPIRENISRHNGQGLCLCEQMFNCHLWLCHWYIAPDVAQSDAQSSTIPSSSKVSSSKSPPSVYVQSSSMTLSLIYRIWCFSMLVPPILYIREYICSIIIFDFVTDVPVRPSAPHTRYAELPWVYGQISSLTLSLIYLSDPPQPTLILREYMIDYHLWLVIDVSHPICSISHEQADSRARSPSPLVLPWVYHPWLCPSH